MSAAGVSTARSQDGTEIAFQLHGHGGGTPILSLRPPQFSHLVRERQAGASHREYLAYGAGRRIIRLDPRGAGMSQRACQDFGQDALIADVEAVLATAGVTRVIVDAISSSALTALGFAAKHPERVERLIVQNAFMDGSRWWNNPVRRALVNIAEVDWELCTETWAWLTWGDKHRDRTLGWLPTSASV